MGVISRMDRRINTSSNDRRNILISNIVRLVVVGATPISMHHTLPQMRRRVHMIWMAVGKCQQMQQQQQQQPAYQRIKRVLPTAAAAVATTIID